MARSFKDQLKSWKQQEGAEVPAQQPPKPAPKEPPAAAEAEERELSDEELFAKALEGVQGSDAILAKFDRRDLPPSARAAAGIRGPSGEGTSDRALFLQAVGEVRREDMARLKGAEPAERKAADARFARRVARGEVEPQNVLDLHGDIRTKALARTKAFVEAEAAARTTVVLVVHGRGTGVLAGEVMRLLDEHPAVVEHLTAPPALGGEGARVVRLRRTDERRRRRPEG